ncbi:MAG: MG2 domain-containing protein [Chitinophagales bacterium]
MKKTFFIALCSMLFFYGCSVDRNHIAISSTNFDEEIDPLQNLEFNLNKHVFNDTLFNKWVAEPLLTFDPPVAGRFQIASSDKIIFSPSKGFSESEKYTVKLTDAIYTYATDDLPVKADPISFHTPYLQIISADMFWSKDELSNDIVLNANVHLTANMAIEDVGSHFRAESANGQHTIKCLSTSAGKSMQIAIFGISTEQANDKLSFTIKKGVGSPGSIWKTEKDLTYKTEVPNVSDLEIRDITAEHNGLEGTITVIANQQIGNPDPEKQIQITPRVDFTCEKTMNGLVIKSDAFDARETYSITLSNSLYGVAGGKMKDDYTQNIAFGELEPSIAFVQDQGMYLGRKGNKNIAVQIVNIPEVKVEVIKIFENNILGFMRDGFRYNWYDTYDEEEGYWDYFDYQDVNTDLYGSVIYTKAYTTAKLEKLNGARILHIDYPDKLERFDGFYVIKVSSTEKQWLTDAQIVSVSDIGLIAKATDDEVVVFANSIESAAPISGVKVNFISSNNQTLFTATTDKNGIAKFSGLKEALPDFDVNLITAKSGTDYNFLPFSKTQVSTSRFDVGGKRLNESDLDAFLYAERNLYRPGETMHIACVVRSYAWETPPNLPMKIKVIAPSGKIFKSIKKTLDAEGACSADFELPANAVTGTYSVQVFSPNDILIASKNISVEEFMPDRIRVSGKLQKKIFYPGDSVLLSIHADNLYGTPASNRNWESSMTLNRSWFTSKKFPGYSFNLTTGIDYFSTLDGTGQTDKQGDAEQMYSISSGYTNIGILDGRILSTVFDESGRPVYAVQDFTVHTQDHLFGIGDFDYYGKTDHAVTIPFVAVDMQDKVVNGAQADVVVVKHEYETVIEKHGSYYSYRSNHIEKIMMEKTMTISGENTRITYTPKISGSYEVRIFIPGATAYVGRNFYAYGWGSTQSNSFEVNTEGNINIVADKDAYLTGEEANLLFTAPFNGKILVTVERDKVFSNYYLQTDNKTASMKLKMNSEDVPNIYVTATLFRPGDNSGLPLTVAHGIINLKVDDPDKKLSVQVTHAKNSRSDTKQTIKIKTEPHTQFTLAVVDEGILQIKNYASPDPYAYFYMAHALGVFSYDLYAQLYPELYIQNLLSGGDGFDLEGRTNPMTANRVKLISYWSDILQTDGSGNASYTIDIPHFSGDLRVMVVAYKGDKFGSSESHMIVADPFVVTTSLPRFLTPGDTVTVPVTLANTTDKGASGSVALKVEGPIRIAGSENISFKAGAKEEGSVAFKIVATGNTGIAKLTVSAKGLGETFTESNEISVRPPASLQKRTGSGSIKGGESLTVAMPAGFIKEGSKASLTVSRSPLIQFADDLDYLVQYPHGCVEQITSGAFPQLYYGDMVRSLYGKDHPDLEPDRNVQKAINMLQNMQMSNGAMMYWPGYGTESWWGTIYAAHFLLEAKKAGFEVDQSVLDKSFGYMRSMLKQKKTFVYRYNATESREVAMKEVFYSIYVLALAGKADISVMNYYKANMSLVPLDGKYLLAFAYDLAGDKKNFQNLLPSTFSGEESVQVFGGSFYSPIRDRAIALNCMLDTDPDNQQVGILSQQLSTMMKKQRYLNTQERVFAFLAFGKIARKTKDSNVTASVFLNNKEIGTFNGKELLIEDATLLSGNVEIRTKGSGSLYYFWRASGNTADGSYKEEDNFLRVRKTFLNKYGQSITLNNVKQNDLIIVRIALTGSTGTYVDNVVITDMLPAGFEIENSRLRESPSNPWIKDAANADYMDMRDDRINLYTSAEPTTKYFYYTVRAVSPGYFKMGPVSADAMYNEEYHSYNGAGFVRISR